jgi:glycosyltransferase involved in cell wall biosynthesis
VGELRAVVVIVHFVVPEAIDDPMRPSGGNVYDRRLAAELVAAGWAVREHRVVDEPDLTRVLAALPDQATVLIDGLVASGEAMVAEAARLRLVLLLHMSVAEPKVLHAVRAAVTTSGWTRNWVIAHHGVHAERVYVAPPGVDVGPLVAGSARGGELLCVGPVTSDKGHDVLVEALREIDDLEWRCTCAGALDLDPAFVDRLRMTGIAGRVAFTGPITRTRLEEIRSTTDLVVSASRRESFGMAVAEGLARGIPVVATSVGGHPEVVGPLGDGSRPGLLVQAGDAGALATALRRWLTDAALRERLRRSAAARRATLTGWAETARVVSDVLNRVDLTSVLLSSGHRTGG